MAKEKTLKIRIRNRHAPQSYWESDKMMTFVPRAGELIFYDTDEDHIAPRAKLGDGITAIHNLAFMNNGTAGAPYSHASDSTEHGAGTALQYGHVKLSDVYKTEEQDSLAENSMGASQHALNAAYTELNSICEELTEAYVELNDVCEELTETYTELHSACEELEEAINNIVPITDAEIDEIMV